INKVFMVSSFFNEWVRTTRINYGRRVYAAWPSDDDTILCNCLLNNGEQFLGKCCGKTPYLKGLVAISGHLHAQSFPLEKIGTQLQSLGKSGQGHMKDGIQLTRVWSQLTILLDQTNKRRNQCTCQGSARTAGAQQAYGLGGQTNFFVSFAQRRGEQIGIARFPHTAGKGHLPGMALEMRGAQGIEQLGLGLNTKKRQHRRLTGMALGSRVNVRMMGQKCLAEGLPIGMHD